MFSVFLQFNNDILCFFFIAIGKNTDRVFQSQRQTSYLLYAEGMMSGSRFFCKP